MMKVLQLSTYPIELPRHGGQARVANIAETYRSAGISTRVVAVYQEELYAGKTVGPADVPFPPASRFREPGLPLCTDLATGTFASSDPEAWMRLRRAMDEFRPGVVQLEQPWLWPAVRRMRDEGRLDGVRVVYSSQNVEAPLKARLHAHLDGETLRRITDRIEQLEREVVAEADLTIAVTEADAAVYRTWGAHALVVASNGIVERLPHPTQEEALRVRVAGRRFALFVGSAYPPNIAGFWDMLAPSLGFLAPDELIVVAGGISDLLVDSSTYRRWELLNASRLLRIGPVTEGELAALLCLASCIILPITIGGGSNIKTAEAIFSGKPVIGTSLAYRGYEALCELRGLHRSDDPVEFRRLIAVALRDRLLDDRGDDADLRRSVLWSATLRGLPAAVAALG